MVEYSSQQVARMLGIAPPTLTKYIKTGKIPQPKSVTGGGMTLHLWTEAEVEHLRKLLPKIKNGRKTRYKKKQLAVGNHQSAEAKARKAKPRKK
jgi:predicted DNA-binding transcriptional regulator AlpA